MRPGQSLSALCEIHHLVFDALSTGELSMTQPHPHPPLPPPSSTQGEYYEAAGADTVGRLRVNTRYNTFTFST